MFYTVYVIVLMLFAFITELFHRIVVIMAHVSIPVAPSVNVGASMVVYPPSFSLLGDSPSVTL